MIASTAPSKAAACTGPSTCSGDTGSVDVVIASSAVPMCAASPFDAWCTIPLDVPALRAVRRITHNERRSAAVSAHRGRFDKPR